jgi:hypothetical protein
MTRSGKKNIYKAKHELFNDYELVNLREQKHSKKESHLVTSHNGIIS